MHEKLVNSSSLVQSFYACHNMLTKVILFFFGIALWSKWSSLPAGILLTVFWVLDGGFSRLRWMIKEPFVMAILFLSGVIALGMLWGDYPEFGYIKWRRYFAFLVFIPFLSLLNKDRLPWAICGLLIGYSGVLLMGFYQWAIVGEQGIPPLSISYLSFSLMLGIGIILTIYLASINSDKKIKSALWFFGAFLLFLQFNQDARGPLLATLLSTALLILLLYKTKIRILIGIASSLTAVILLFAFSSNSFQERLIQILDSVELYQQGKYDTSLGYRLAIWDVGLHGIMQQPLVGYGTGKAGSYFEDTITTYKDGRYKDLPEYHETTSYHNDWIEIGMHVGVLGLLALACLLGGWFQTLRAYQLPILGATLVSFVFLSGLTDTFVLYSKIPTLLLVITAIAISWQKEKGTIELGNRL
ncbi:O-antigen ligase [Nitrosomonas sp. Nm33]|uniref:O-antigen ligase family protein n=1 Tax=Nitrosomonas sp. Nm33 TaxID=133724 RepID=UPI0008990CD6|nr:O-antigen ligase family protein [Nitrosomonas sp. Nm33]SDY69747.1 O-antigen ligase [Nitrosomonas sp. Nm33]